MEAALIGGLVADEDAELGRDAFALFEGPRLEADGALHQPLVLRHLVDEDGFSVVDGLVVGEQGGEEGIVAIMVLGMMRRPEESP